MTMLSLDYFFCNCNKLWDHWSSIDSTFLLFDVFHLWSNSGIDCNADLCKFDDICLEQCCYIHAFNFSHFQSSKSFISSVPNSQGFRTDKMLLSTCAVHVCMYTLCLLSFYHFCQCPGMCYNQDGCCASRKIRHCYILESCPPVKSIMRLRLVIF